MSLVTLPFRLPFLPVTAVIRLAQLIEEQAEQELHDPAAVRRALEEAEEARLSGRASDAEVAEMEDAAVARLVPPVHRPRGEAAGDGDGS